MRLFRASLAARLLSAGAALGLLGAGLIPIVGIPLTTGIPLVLLLPIVFGMLALAMGVNQHPGASVAVAIALPVVFWVFVLGIIALLNQFPQYSWTLIAASGVPLLFFVGSIGVRREAHAPAATPTTHPAPRMGNG
jgi:hypothetical protein